jgi:hypothetical protein
MDETKRISRAVLADRLDTKLRPADRISPTETRARLEDLADDGGDIRPPFAETAVVLS